jgi:hypothetical protein
MTPGHCCFFAISVSIVRTPIDYGYHILCTARIALGSLGFQGPPYLVRNQILPYLTQYSVQSIEFAIRWRLCGASTSEGNVLNEDELSLA